MTWSQGRVGGGSGGGGGGASLSASNPANVGTAASAGSATDASKHDHVHALTESIVRSVMASLTASLDVNAQAITNVGNVDGVHVSAHASRHSSGGADAIPAGGIAGAQLANNTVTSTQLGTGANVEAAIRSGLSALTADPDFNARKLTNLLDPTSAQHAATKAYVDSVAAGLSPKPSVLAASTANVAALTGILTTVDGVALNTAGMRVLLKDQSTASENGLWLVQVAAWTRPTDFAVGAHAAGSFVFVESGTVNASSGWVCTTVTNDVINTNNLNFTQFSGAGEITAGTGLSKSGNTLSITAGGVQATQLGTGVQIESAIRAAFAALTADVTIPAGIKVDGYDIGAMGDRVALMPDSSYSTIQKDGATAVAQQGALNVITGSGISLTLANNSGASRSDLTIAASYGTSSSTVCVGNDSRLSDARTPTAHETTHLSNGSDPIAAATTSVGGLMSAADKVTLGGLCSNAERSSLTATTNATPTNIGTAISIASGEVIEVNTWVEGRLTTFDGNVVRYGNRFLVSNNGGTVTVKATAQLVGPFEDASLAAAVPQTMAVTNGSPGTAQLQVTGIAATNMSWTAYIEVFRML